MSNVQPINTDKQDIKAIENVVKLYFDGTHYSDVEKMKQAFASECEVIGKTMRIKRDQWLEGVAEREPPADKGAAYDYKIDEILINQDIAVAKLTTPINGKVFTDVATLLNFDDEGWKIVSKVFFINQ